MAASDMDSGTKPPTSEVGAVVPYWSGWTGRKSNGAATATWDALMDDVERVMELRGQEAIRTYQWMMTDAQVASVMMGVVLPLMRYQWSLRPNGADAAAVERFADNFGLPIEGSMDETDGVDGTRFTFHEHLRAALLMLRYGYSPFEQVGYIADDGWFMYRKLAERPPRSIMSVDVASDGGLAGITQEGGRGGVVIPVNRLVMYSWDREGAHWQGQPMLRPMYRHVLVKDRLIRVDAMKHERNGMGIPTAWAPPNATTEVMLALQEITSAMKAGEEAGMAMPPGSDVRLLGVQGTLPDTIASVEYHDRAIAKAGLAMVLELGSSASGNRALGGTFSDLWAGATDYIASHVCATFTQHVIRDWFRWNMGADAKFPLLVAKRPPDPALSVGDFRSLVEVGAVTLDSELEQFVRREHRLPAKPKAADDAPAGQSYAYDLTNGIITIDDRRAQLGLVPREDGLGALTAPEFLALVAGIGVTDPDAQAMIEDAVQGTGALDTGGEVTPAGVVAASRRMKAVRFSASVTGRREAPQLVAAAAPGTTRATDFDPAFYPEGARRQPFEHEVRAATDFTVLDALWDDATGKLVKSWAKVRDEQSNAITKAIVDADGDLTKLAAITAPDAGSSSLLASAMQDMADSAAAIMAEEAKRQGITLPAVRAADYAELVTARAEAVAKVMADDLTSGAVKHALRLTGDGSPLTAAQVAAQVGEGIAELTDAYLETQLGSAMQAAQNTGRFAAAEQARVPTRWYASELLDSATCSECAGVDGKEYASMAEAQQDYPTGGYANCQGRERCRGTIVVVYDESGATVQGDVDSEPGAG